MKNKIDPGLTKALGSIDFEQLTSVVANQLRGTYSGVIDRDEASGWAGLGISLAITVFDPSKVVDPAKAYDVKTIRAFLKRKGYLLAMDEMRREKVVDRKVKDEVKKTTLVTRNFSAVNFERGPKNDRDAKFDPQDGHSTHVSERLTGADFMAWTKTILKKTEWDLIHYYYKCRVTMYHIGIILNMSEARVSQVHSIIIEKIKKAAADQ
jgi:hypothetical protein